MPRGLILKKNAAGRWMDDNGGDWSERLAENRGPGWDMLDRDLAIIDSATLDIRYVTGLMNICMGVGVNPHSGVISVIGTDAKNEIRFEPNLRGTFLRVNLALIQPDTLTPQVQDLNPHLDYQASLVAPPIRNQSIGDPRGIAWNAAGTRGYVTGMGSRNLTVIGATGQRLGAPIELPDGPSGLAVDEARGRLYVLNRFAASLSVLDLAGLGIVTNVPLFDPTPAAIKAGRRHLYDTRLNSGLGHVSCASCHVDARFDRLAWDLGNPGLNATESPEQSVGGQHVFFHPLKGPLVTQTLQDIIRDERLHWRGDRQGIESFNITFPDLLGRDAPLSESEMQEFKDLLSTIHFPPSRFRHLDNSFPTNVTLPAPFEFEDDGTWVLATSGNAARGRLLFNADCRGCHLDQTGRGAAEDEEAVLSLRSGVPLKVAQLRSLAEKVGCDFSSTNSRAGFGFGRDGRFDSIPAFLHGIPNFSRPNDLMAFLVAFPGSQVDTDPGLVPGGPSQDAPAGVGRQLTVRTAAAPALLYQMIALAQSATSRVDLVAHGSRTNGPGPGWSYHRETRRFLTERNEELATLEEVLAEAGEMQPITFMLVQRGTSRRLGVDRDDDGHFNQFEFEHGTDPFSPLSRGSNSAPSLGWVLGQDGAVQVHLHPGMTLTAAFAATDPEEATQKLNYSLGPEAPPGAMLHPVNGGFSWTPTVSEFEQTHRFTVKVQDDGIPSFSDSRLVIVTVEAARILDLTFPHGPLALFNEREISWRSVPGESYQLEWKDHLEEGSWVGYPTIQATSPLTTAIDYSKQPLPQRFYRIRWVR